jgi:hypothetical protein
MEFSLPSHSNIHLNFTEACGHPQQHCISQTPLHLFEATTKFWPMELNKAFVQILDYTMKVRGCFPFLKLEGGHVGEPCSTMHA